MATTTTTVFEFNNGVHAAFIADAFGPWHERVDLSLDGVTVFSLINTSDPEDDYWTLKRYAKGSAYCQQAMCSILSEVCGRSPEFIKEFPVGDSFSVEGVAMDRFNYWMFTNLKQLSVGGITRGHKEVHHGLLQS